MNRRELIEQAKFSCNYQEDLSFDSVRRYVRACEFIQNYEITDISVNVIRTLGKIVSHKNVYGFRVTPVMFLSGNSGVNPEHIIRGIANIVDAHNNMYLSPSDFFIEFEKIHPFNDGNGRVGEIIYWRMTNSFECPHDYFKN